MKKFTNFGKVPLSLAVWLMADDYDHDDDPNVISATSLLKPIKATVLARQSKELDKVSDLVALIPSRMGTAIHESIESSWLKTDQLKTNLRVLGEHPDGVIDRIIVNPKPEEIKDDSLCVYMEIRKKKQVGKFTISGKFDIVIDGRLEDFKSTGTYGYMQGSNDNQYIQQGSIYRWLNPDIITEPNMAIQYIFTDWNALSAFKDKNYPPYKTAEKLYPLMSEVETQTFIEDIVSAVTRLENKAQAELPDCTPEELWQKADVYKYYKDPTKTARSTKNFDNAIEANARFMADGNVGFVKHIPGQIVRCRYCDVVGVCDQAAKNIKAGLLTL